LSDLGQVNFITISKVLFWKIQDVHLSTYLFSKVHAPDLNQSGYETTACTRCLLQSGFTDITDQCNCSSIYLSIKGDRLRQSPSAVIGNVIDQNSTALTERTDRAAAGARFITPMRAFGVSLTNIYLTECACVTLWKTLFRTPCTHSFTFSGRSTPAAYIYFYRRGRATDSIWTKCYNHLSVYRRVEWQQCSENWTALPPSSILQQLIWVQSQQNKTHFFLIRLCCFSSSMTQAAQLYWSGFADNLVHWQDNWLTWWQDRNNVDRCIHRCQWKCLVSVVTLSQRNVQLPGWWHTTFRNFRQSLFSALYHFPRHTCVH